MMQNAYLYKCLCKCKEGKKCLVGCCITVAVSFLRKDRTWHADARMPGRFSAASSKDPQSIMTAQCVTRSHQHTEAKKQGQRTTSTHWNLLYFTISCKNLNTARKKNHVACVCKLQSPLSWLYFVFFSATVTNPELYICIQTENRLRVWLYLNLFGNSCDTVHPTDSGCSRNKKEKTSLAVWIITTEKTFTLYKLLCFSKWTHVWPTLLL